MWYVVTEYGVPKAVFERKSEAEKAVENRPGEIHPVVKCETAAEFLSDLDYTSTDEVESE